MAMRSETTYDSPVSSVDSGFIEEIHKASEQCPDRFFNRFDEDTGDVDYTYLSGHCEFGFYFLLPLLKFVPRHKEENRTRNRLRRRSALGCCRAALYTTTWDTTTADSFITYAISAFSSDSKAYFRIASAHALDYPTPLGNAVELR